jgi:hypothetical protein
MSESTANNAHPFVLEPYILTATGKAFWFDDPQPEQICIEDIAWSLAMNCRFTGHTRHFYSVAQHCFNASFIVPERFALEALLHDASEAYLADINKPAKMLLPDYQALEAKVEKAIAAKFGLPYPMSTTVKTADLRMLHTEYLQLMPRDTKSWGLEDYPPLNSVIVPFGPEYAREVYMARFVQLTTERKAA